MKRAYKILIAIVIVGILGAGFGWWYAHRPSKGAADKDVDATVTAAALITEFKADVAKADKKYNAKNVQISGKISTIEKGANNSVSVQIQEGDDIIEASFSDEGTTAVASKKAGDNITLNGLYSGSDNAIGMEIKLNKCALVK